jgi:hypothetical protein
MSTVDIGRDAVRPVWFCPNVMSLVTGSVVAPSADQIGGRSAMSAAHSRSAPTSTRLSANTTISSHPRSVIGVGSVCPGRAPKGTSRTRPGSTCHGPADVVVGAADELIDN